jgi:hypothetical protein
MAEEEVVKYDEMGVMDGGTVGLGRPMNRDIFGFKRFSRNGAHF